MDYKKVTPETFAIYLKIANQRDKLYRHKTCYIAYDCNSGFAITNSGLLCHVFSLKPGAGRLAVKKAIKLGAIRLSCYNKQQEMYYGTFGFYTTFRSNNKYWMCRKNIGGAACIE